MPVGAPVKASSQRGSASLCGSSDNATASTNVTSSPLAVPAVIAASPWSSTPERDRYTTRPQARGRPETRAPGASLMRSLNLRLKPKAAATPNSGRGPVAEIGGVYNDTCA